MVWCDCLVELLTLMQTDANRRRLDVTTFGTPTRPSAVTSDLPKPFATYEAHWKCGAG